MGAQQSQDMSPKKLVEMIIVDCPEEISSAIANGCRGLTLEKSEQVVTTMGYALGSAEDFKVYEKFVQAADLIAELTNEVAKLEKITAYTQGFLGSVFQCENNCRGKLSHQRVKGCFKAILAAEDKWGSLDVKKRDELAEVALRQSYPAR